jgi:glycerophosphoryl diester phosphodiesterase
MSGEAAIKYLFYYYTGLLPFVPIYQDAFSVPYMTRDYLAMKLVEAREKSYLLYIYILITILANKTANPLMEHFNKRGILTNYWVINDDDEIKRVLNQTKVIGLMSDRPSRVVEIIKEEAKKKELLKNYKGNDF